MEEFNFTMGDSNTVRVVVLSLVDYVENYTVVISYNVFAVNCSLYMLISSYDSWQE